MEPIPAGWKRYFSVQPPMMLFLFSISISNTILTDLMEYRACNILFSINETECSVLHENSNNTEMHKINAIVQPLVSTILMTKSFIDSTLPALLSLFYGPWSDKYGRKPILLAGYIGSTISFSFLSILSYLEVSPWFLLIASVPTAFFGGFCGIILSSICYISDITRGNERVWQLGCLQIFIYIGLIFGVLAGPVIFNSFGYTAVFSLAAIANFFALIYILLFVKESVQTRQPKTLKSLFEISLVKDLVNTCTKKQEGINRCVIWCCISALVLNVLIIDGESTIGYLFANEKLGWNVENYSIYSAISLVIGVLGTIFGISVIGKYIVRDETILAILFVTSGFAGSIVKALTWKSWHMYLAVAIGMFNIAFSPVARTILSKSVFSSDSGKVFSLTTSLEAITPFGAASLYGMIYSHYMPPVYPTFVWLLSAGFYLIMILLLVILKIKINLCHEIHYTRQSQES